MLWLSLKWRQIVIPTFIGQFVESLFFFGAFFDSLADCLKDHETSRKDDEACPYKCLEGVFLLVLD